MVGIGRTVFEGTQRRGVQGAHPRRARERHRPAPQSDPRRLEGGPLADTGVIAGMSGSPVYIDGRLIGAVSYALGSFSKEPIAGITPIAEMTDATAVNDVAAARRARAASTSRSRATSLTAAFRRALNWNRPFADRAGRRRASPASARVAGLGGGELGTLLRPIATPLVMSGLRARRGGHARQRVPRSGFRPDGRQRRPGSSRRDAVRRSAQAGRRDRRDARQRRPAARRHRHGHPRRRRPRLRVRPPDLQPRADRVPDDAGLRLHGAAEPVLVDEALEHGRRHRHVPAGPRDGDRRPARARPAHDSDHAHARVGPRRRSARSTSTSSTISCSRR